MEGESLLGLESFAEVFALEELHDEVGELFLDAVILDVDEVGVSDACGSASFARSAVSTYKPHAEANLPVRSRHSAR